MYEEDRKENRGVVMTVPKKSKFGLKQGRGWSEKADDAREVSWTQIIIRS